METRSFIIGRDWFDGKPLEYLRKVLDEYIYAARLPLNPIDVYGIIGQLDFDHSVDQNIYNYIHSSSCEDQEIAAFCFSRRKVKCNISVLALLRNICQATEYFNNDINCWVDVVGNFWPTNQLGHDREDREIYTDLAVRRWKQELEMSAEEASLDALSDIVAYCWYGGQARHMKVRTLGDFLPKSFRPRLSDPRPNEQQLAAEGGYLVRPKEDCYD